MKPHWFSHIYYWIGVVIILAGTALPASASSPSLSLQNRQVGTTDVSAISTLAPPRIVVAGGDHMCEVTTAEEVWCWGRNDRHQLGDGSTDDRSVPVRVAGMNSGIKELAAGGLHTCVLTTGGVVICWGANQNGQLGNGTTAEQSMPELDQAVTGLPGGIVAIAAGGNHTCALTSGGAMWCWGENNYGQVGKNYPADQLTPQLVLSGGITQMAMGGEHTCALTSGGGVKCWGGNNQGQLGDNSLTRRDAPVDVSGLTNGVQWVTAGDKHTCALTTSGGVKCWGFNDNGQVGDGSKTTRLIPVDVNGLSNGYKALTAGTQYTCVLATTGTAKCWGYNSSGQLGNGTLVNSTTPVSLSSLSGAVSITTGWSHTCVVTNTDIIVCWGENYYGQLGDGTNTDRSTPVNVRSPYIFLPLVRR